MFLAVSAPLKIDALRLRERLAVDGEEYAAHLGRIWRDTLNLELQEAVLCGSEMRVDDDLRIGIADPKCPIRAAVQAIEPVGSESGRSPGYERRDRRVVGG